MFKKPAFRTWAPLLITLFLIAIGLEIASDIGWVNEQLIPSPSATLAAFTELRSDFMAAIYSTAGNAFRGLVLSFIFGTGIAIACSLSNLLRRAVLPLAIFFQTVPIIAIAPLLVIYFGFGDQTVITSAFIVSIFPIIANTLVGLDEVDQSQIDLFRIYGGSDWQILWRLRVPSSYTSVISGIKISIGLALIGTVAGEFVAGSGLGALIDSARTQQRIDIVFAFILVIKIICVLPDI